MKDLIYAMKKEMFRRRYSVKTIKSYVFCVEKFLRYYGSEKITKKNVKEFIEEIMDRDYADSTINIYVNAIKFFIEDVLYKRWVFRFKFSRVPKKFSDFLTKEEVIRLLNSISNRKHRLMIALMYSAGLRVGELVNLKIEDLNFENNYGIVKNGKGNKQRLFIIAEKLKNVLIEFVKDLKEEDFLFKGNSDGHLSIASVQMIVKRARKKAKIKKNIHPHTLRHSFATHLIEDKNDILAAQPLLGHSSMETTMGYAHRAYPIIINVKSPFDSLQF